MSWESRYTPPDPYVWQGPADSPINSHLFQRVQLLNFLTQRPDTPSQPTFAIIGFKCDEGLERDLTRTGAKEAPTAIRRALAALPLHHDQAHIYDIGNIVCDDHDMELSQKALGDVIAILLSLKIQPIVLGGSHELSFGHFQGLSQTIPPQKKIGILNFDAHFDLHPATHHHRNSATTTFHQIAIAHQLEKRHFDYNCVGIQSSANDTSSFELAKTFNTHYLLADDVQLHDQERCDDFMNRLIEENDFIYVSISLDVFSPAFAPGVSTIQPLGLYPWQVIPFLRKVAASGKAISYDIVEHTPLYDIDHRTAKLAAALIFDILHATLS
jgi:formiminoglutamase